MASFSVAFFIVIVFRITALVALKDDSKLDKTIAFYSTSKKELLLQREQKKEEVK